MLFARWRPWRLAAAAYVVITLPFVSPLINYRHLADASDLMRRIGIRYVVLHTHRAEELPRRAPAAQSSDYIRLIGHVDGDYLYEIRP